MDTPYPFERAWNYALWLLGRQMRSAAQLRARLGKKGATPADIERVIQKLLELRYLDDAGFAEAYVRGHKHKKGSLALARELAHKGIPEELRETALHGLGEGEQLKTARALVEKNRWRWQGKPRAKSRAFAFLARRGFPAEVARHALEASGLSDSP